MTDAGGLIMCPILCYSNGTDKNNYLSAKNQNQHKNVCQAAVAVATQKFKVTKSKDNANNETDITG